MNREVIRTGEAPGAIGTYSQAIKINDTVYISGQIPLVPETGEMLDGNMEAQVRRVFDSLSAIAAQAGGKLDDAVKFNVFLTDLGNFATVNKVMEDYLQAPYPARAAVEVSALPKGAEVEVDAILVVK